MQAATPVSHVGSIHVRSQQIGRYSVPREDQLRSCTALASADHVPLRSGRVALRGGPFSVLAFLRNVIAIAKEPLRVMCP